MSIEEKVKELLFNEPYPLEAILELINQARIEAESEALIKILGWKDKSEYLPSRIRRRIAKLQANLDNQRRNK